jgi:hypothetical protein
MHTDIPLLQVFSRGGRHWKGKVAGAQQRQARTTTDGQVSKEYKNKVDRFKPYHLLQ